MFLSVLPTYPAPANPDSLANLRNPSNLRHHRHTVLSTATLANLRTLVAYCHLLVFVFQTLQKQPVLSYTIQPYPYTHREHPEQPTLHQQPLLTLAITCVTHVTLAYLFALALFFGRSSEHSELT